MRIKTYAAAAALVALVVILIGSFQPMYLTIFWSDRRAYSDFLTKLPYRKAPGFHEFLLEASKHIPPRTAVVFISDHTRFEGGYRYHFSRAEYVLAHADVMAVIGPGEVPLPLRREPQLVLSWGTVPPDRFEIFWRHGRGSLARARP